MRLNESTIDVRGVAQGNWGLVFAAWLVAMAATDEALAKAPQGRPAG